MSEEAQKVAPPGGGFHVLPSEIVVMPQPAVEAVEPEAEPDQGDCDACDRK
jgi:hypothetical protein